MEFVQVHEQCCCSWQVSVSDVDRGRLDFTTISAIVVDVNSTDARTTYRVACKRGLLKTSYLPGDLKRLPLATAALMGLDGVLEHWLRVKGDTPLSRCRSIGVRVAAAGNSLTGGQGMVHCTCKGVCDSKRCSCFNANRLCNSRCHKGRSCCNRASSQK